MGRLIARENEMGTLESEYSSSGASLVVVYGRRRVGKTTLITEFMGRHPNGLYILAREAPIENNLVMFQQKIGDYLGVGRLGSDWADLLKSLRGRDPGERMVVAIDEFQYLAQDDSSFLSELQDAWDTCLKDLNIMLILCGSYRRMMESQLLNSNSPMYGRRTAQILLRPIPFDRYHEFFPDMSERELVESYSVTGGVPKYIETFFGGGEIFTAIRDKVLNPDSYLHSEVAFILSGEVTDMKGSMPLMAAISGGSRKLSDISSRVGLKQTDITKALQTLRGLDLVDREVPVTEGDPSKSKSGLYRISNRYFDFWFRYVYPYQDMLESRHPEYVEARIRETFVQGYVSFVYEGLCREQIWHIDEVALKLLPTRVGRYWGKGADETDVVVMDDVGKRIMVGECKYSGSPKDTRVMKGLKGRMDALSRLTGYEPAGYIVFSMSGFTDDMREYAERNGVILVEGVTGRL